MIQMLAKTKNWTNCIVLTIKIVRIQFYYLLNSFNITMVHKETWTVLKLLAMSLTCIYEKIKCVVSVYLYYSGCQSTTPIYFWEIMLKNTASPNASFFHLCCAISMNKKLQILHMELFIILKFTKFIADTELWFYIIIK